MANNFLLNNFTSDELAEELERRKKLREIPEKLKMMDWSPVINMLEEEVKDRYNGAYNLDNDNPQYVYESAMQVVYGEDIWKKLNKLR
jgi:hypothetical protein